MTPARKVSSDLNRPNIDQVRRAKLEHDNTVILDAIGDY